jgi:hypothetical protein
MAHLMKKILLFTILSMSWQLANCQYDWWNRKHNWDGKTSWMYYLVYSPGHFGPNALPIPEFYINQNDSLATFSTSYNLNFGSGDYTQHFKNQLLWPVAKDKVVLQVDYIPLEIWKTDTITRDYRAARSESAKGKSVGDFSISTIIKLRNESTNLPTIYLTINLKTASGNNLSNARFTDAPAYFFKADVSKSFRLRKMRLKVYGMIGFYCWQTNEVLHTQDDAILYGSGLGFQRENVVFNASISGYRGYLKNGDSPAKFSFKFTYDKCKFGITIGFDKGIKDQYFNTAYLNLFLRPGYWVKKRMNFGSLAKNHLL